MNQLNFQKQQYVVLWDDFWLPSEIVQKYNFSLICPNPRKTGRSWFAKFVKDVGQGGKNKRLTTIGGSCDQYIPIFSPPLLYRFQYNRRESLKYHSSAEHFSQTSTILFHNLPHKPLTENFSICRLLSFSHVQVYLGRYEFPKQPVKTTEGDLPITLVCLTENLNTTTDFDRAT